jgi:hypothetical protein
MRLAIALTLCLATPAAAQGIERSLTVVPAQITNINPAGVFLVGVQNNSPRLAGTIILDCTGFDASGQPVGVHLASLMNVAPGRTEWTQSRFVEGRAARIECRVTGAVAR